MTLTWPQALTTELRRGQGRKAAEGLGRLQRKAIEIMGRQPGGAWPWPVKESGTDRAVLLRLVRRELIFSLKYPVLTERGHAVVDHLKSE